MASEMAFDQSTITLLRAVLDDAWATLVPAQQEFTTRSEMAERILRRAAEGERDPNKLRTYALVRPVD